jgi:hypothetical protein
MMVAASGISAMGVAAGSILNPPFFFGERLVAVRTSGRRYGAPCAFRLRVEGLRFF